eukprot:7630323-Pyramimonas_sp.AAC.1
MPEPVVRRGKSWRNGGGRWSRCLGRPFGGSQNRTGCAALGALTRGPRPVAAVCPALPPCSHEE